jgi:hypothetical protein
MGILLLAFLVTGCVERKMLIRSEPEGARVWINRSEESQGVTPYDESFTHHGTFAVRLEMEGYKTLVTEAPVETPWYSYPVLDFITEVLLPVTIHDHQEFTFRLEPKPARRSWEEERAEVEKRRAEVIGRANEMREEVMSAEEEE